MNMNIEKAWQDFISLPPDAKLRVLELISFLHQETVSFQSTEETPSSLLSDEEFIGIWQDNIEMQDSTSWVREVRTREWVK